MAESRKVLVVFDPENPEDPSSDFLVPVRNDTEGVDLLGTSSGKVVQYGMVVLTSHAITENDLFARLVDIGRRIPNVDAAVSLLESFVLAMKTVRIGNVVVAEADAGGVKLSVISQSPSGFRK